MSDGVRRHRRGSRSWTAAGPWLLCAACAAAQDGAAGSATAVDALAGADSAADAQLGADSDGAVDAAALADTPSDTAAAGDATAATDAAPASDATPVSDAAPVSDATPASDGTLSSDAAAGDAALTDAADAGLAGEVSAAADAGSPSYPPAAAGGTLSVELGGSSDDGTAIAPWSAPGAAATLIYGPQGGYHVWVSVCGPASLGAKAALRLVLTAAGGQQVHPGPTELTSKLVSVAGKTGQVCRVAAPAFVTCACELAGQAVRVRAELTELPATPGNPSSPPLSGWAEKTVVLAHDLGPCWPAGQAPCATLRGK